MRNIFGLGIFFLGLAIAFFLLGFGGAVVGQLAGIFQLIFIAAIIGFLATVIFGPQLSSNSD